MQNRQQRVEVGDRMSRLSFWCGDCGIMEDGPCKRMGQQFNISATQENSPNGQESKQGDEEARDEDEGFGNSGFGERGTFVAPLRGLKSGRDRWRRFDLKTPGCGGIYENRGR